MWHRSSGSRRCRRSCWQREGRKWTDWWEPERTSSRRRSSSTVLLLEHPPTKNSPKAPSSPASRACSVFAWLGRGPICACLSLSLVFICMVMMRVSWQYVFLGNLFVLYSVMCQGKKSLGSCCLTRKNLDCFYTIEKFHHTSVLNIAYEETVRLPTLLSSSLIIKEKFIAFQEDSFAIVWLECRTTTTTTTYIGDSYHIFLLFQLEEYR